MASFLKPLKGTKSKGINFKPRGAASSDRLKEVLNRNRIESQRAMGMSPIPAPSLNPSSTPNIVTSDKPSCPNPGCPNPSAPVTDGFCSACGREIDSSNIVAEIQFGETSSGAAIVHGSFVGADQGSAARNLAPQYRRLGGGLSDAREKTIREAKNMMAGFAHQLREIPPGAVDTGIQIFKLVMEENWLQGRGMDKVVPVCLYTACRREDKCKVMLIDFAELVKVNVYELGHVFKDLNNIYSFENNHVKSIIPEDLMYRFASKLDFGDFTNKVAADATRLCQRMGRDWMIMGRRPSGICGACILMAARMWNFRRTVREVVYVVKVTTHTIEQRLGEFTVTESSDLSIEDFLNQEFLESRHDPPSFYKNTAEWKEKIEKEKGGQKRKRVIEDIDGTEEPDLAAGASGPENSTTRPSPSPCSQSMPPPPVPRPPPDTSTLRQVTEYLPRTFDNAEGREYITPFDPENVPKPAPKNLGDKDIAEGLNAKDPTGDDAIDGLAAAYGSVEEQVDYNQDEEEADPPEAGSRRRGKKVSAEPVLTYSDEWEQDEAVLEKQIEEVINDPHSDSHRKALATAAHIAYIKGEWARSLLPPRELKMGEIISEDEFADDPEVQHCKLSEEEVKIKESIWINANKDWLRKQQEKAYRKQMEELGPPKRRRNRVKKPRIGEGQLTPASTPGEAAVEALKKRNTYSKRINYDAITSLFSGSNKNRGPGSVMSRNDSETASRLASRAGSVSDAGTPQPAGARSNQAAAPSDATAAAADKPAEDEEAEEDYHEEDHGEVAEEAYDYDDDQDQPVYDEDGYDEEEYY
ncbi:hypothetical protein GGS23DRAFT_547965 [Durotheca rogersii]|uniref:uncharacterized protein n=1 Tax=Durotheca rogersii TaxID=419775 RepID=UPI00221FB574|nr:uncharacterized protein GGS23DRAFT_547965 [Durotheca rogersii]KAI5867360.1 hypothetical protein GGS23DRAFT_547965 [Durotheca rogersii]